MSKVTSIRGSELGPGEVRVWAAIQSSNASLASPYFCPEFTVLVASVRDDVRVGILSEGGHAVGFFPFQSVGAAKAEPLASPAADFHGVIASPATNWKPKAVLRGCRLDEWTFHHLLAGQAPFQPYHQETYPSMFLDLSNGFEHYAQQREAVGTRQLRQVEASRRKLENERGSVRFVSHASGAEVLTQLKVWKRSQYVRLETYDRFAVPWLAELLERLWSIQGCDFAGMLSALFCGDELIAAHLGMRSRSVWHYWFPAYSPAFAKYQPGLILLVDMARHARSLGITRIDLSSGNEMYKRRLANASVLLARGRVTATGTARRD